MKEKEGSLCLPQGYEDILWFFLFLLEALSFELSHLGPWSIVNYFGVWTQPYGRDTKDPGPLPVHHLPHLSVCSPSRRCSSFFTNEKTETHREWGIGSKSHSEQGETQPSSPGLGWLKSINFHHCWYCLPSQQLKNTQHREFSCGAGG